MSIKFPQIAGRQTKGPQPRNSHRQRYRWHAELRRQALEAERRDRAAFLKYKGH